MAGDELAVGRRDRRERVLDPFVEGIEPRLQLACAPGDGKVETLLEQDREISDNGLHGERIGP